MEPFNKKNISTLLMLTPMQAGMLFHYLKEPQSPQYFEQLSLDISGEIQVEIFKKAWQAVIQTNEMLRTLFRWEKLEHPTQIILKEHTCPITFYDLSTPSDGQLESLLTEIKEQDKQHPFDLQEVPFRILLCKLAKNRYEMIISNHHILYDGWSNGIILKEFFKVYGELSQGKNPILPNKPSFKEFVKWVQNQDKAKQEVFWQQTLTHIDTQTELPIKKRKTGNSMDTDTYSFVLASDHKSKLEDFVRTNRVTLAGVFYTAWGILLHRYCSSQDVVFGTPVSGRAAKIKGIEEMVGLFINTIPLRVQTDANEKLGQLVSRVDGLLQAREAFENTPLPDILRYSGLRGNESLFDTIMAIENYPLDSRLLPQDSPLSLQGYGISEMTHYDLTASIVLFHDLEVRFTYLRESFHPNAIEHVAGHFKRILQHMVETPDLVLGQLEIISLGEKNMLLFDFNSPAATYPADQTIPQLFARQVERTPHHPALTGHQWGKGPVALTYRQLDRIASGLALALIETGLGPQGTAAILVERSVDMIFALLAILQTGAAYVPLDPKTPVERLHYVLADCGATILLTFRHLAASITADVDKFYLEEFSHADPTRPVPTVHPASHADHLAYIIYTSGSTGRPKGVPICHRNFSPLMFWGYAYLGIGSADRVIQNLSYYFDWSVWEICIALTSGARLDMITEEILLDPAAMVAFIREQAITALHITPTQYGYLVNIGLPMPSLRHLSIGAEKLTYDLVARTLPLLAPACRIYNMYGPTEATIMSAVLEIDREQSDYYRQLGSVPIGGTIANTALLVLDPTLNLCPVGVVGELYIAGDALARGYLNDPEKTAASFVPNPFAGVGRSQLYKTGDRVRWLPDGSILFMGRADFQVKIRGLRIELGEIESGLRQYPSIKDTLVLVKEDLRQEKYICAYLVCPGDLDTVALREFLATRLPAYMIPTHFVTLEQMPLNPNGKVDRKALPDPLLNAASLYQGPSNDIEIKMQEIWCRVLFGEIARDNAPDSPLEKIGIHDNFFQMGGHSLKTTSLASQIHKVFQVKISLSEIFKRPTIRQLADYIQKATREKYTGIEPVEEKEFHPLSSAQRRLHFLQQLDQEGTTYNIFNSWLLEGKIDTNHLQQALEALIQRHESFRTSFHIFNEEPVQRIHPTVPFHIHTSHSSHFIRPFDLTQAPLLRIGLVQLAEAQHLLLVDMHHIISDGLSIEILVREFSALLTGQELPPTGFRYKDYAEWQNQQKQSQERQEQERYWSAQFTGDIPLLELPTDFPRPALQSFAGQTIHVELDPHLTQSIRLLSATAGATPYMVILAMFTIFLGKISGQEDIVIGTPVAGRPHADLQHIIGMFVNTLPLRNTPTSGKTFDYFLDEVRDNTLKAFENQEYPYEDLVEKVGVHRETSRNPLFDAAFALLDTGSQAIDIPSLKVVPRPPENTTAKFDLTLTVLGTPEKLALTFEYCTDLFKVETIQRFISYFKNIVAAVTANTQQTLGQIPILSPRQRQELLLEVNDLGTRYPNQETIHGLFARQVEKTPHHIALTGCPGLAGRPIQLTYAQLNHQANRLAELLISNGVCPHHTAAVLVERSVDMIIALLAVLQAGAAYVPLDPKTPANRLHYVLQDCRATLLLTFRHLATPLHPATPTLYLEELPLSPSPTAISLSTSSTPPDHLAYIIYTSGSTGTPKGVPISHRNFCPLVHWGYHHLGIDATDHVIQNLSYYFDWSVWEIFITLTSGAQLFMITEEILLDPRAMVAFIQQQAITVLHITPTQYGYLVNTGLPMLSLRHLCIGAEKLTFDLVQQTIPLISTDCRIYNLYGPTEATIISAVADVDPQRPDYYRQWASVPIGLTIGNTALLVLDASLNPCPVNVIGELYIAGDALARGYLNDPEKTASTFIKNPFREIDSPYLYKTGDRVRRLPDNAILFIGRADFQVKIRGYRIELGEIESGILQFPDIKDTLVLVKEDQTHEKYLCAYVACPGDLDTVALRDFLATRLPAYMIPTHFVKLEQMPLNPNGKVDRNALPEPQLTGGVDYQGPRNEVETRLLTIWQQVLHGHPISDSPSTSNRIGIRDNFFHVGGHSLKTTSLASQIHKVFHVRISLAEVFKRPTIQQLADYIQKATRQQFTCIEPVEEKEYHPLSSAQKRLHFLQQLDKEGTTYNIFNSWLLQGKIDINHLQQALATLIQRHESFRTSFHMINEEPVQRIHPTVPFHLHTSHKSHNLFPDFIQPFDLTQAPLLRVDLISETVAQHLLMVDMHHIISDGLSIEILLREFSALLSGQELPPIQICYKDYAAWQNVQKQSQERQETERYWCAQFTGDIPVLELPTDFPRPTLQSFAGHTLHFELDPEITRSLRHLATTAGATPYMVMLAIHNIFLAKISGQEDIVIGTAVAGRRHADLEKIIGMFVNTLPLRNTPASNKPFRHFLDEVRDRTLKAFENQEYPYEDMVRKIGVHRETSRNPLFDTAFALIDAGSQAIDMPGLKIVPRPPENTTAKFDLTLTVVEAPEKWELTFEYCTDLFKMETIERFITYYTNLVLAVTRDPQQTLGQIPILSPRQRQELLLEVNDLGTRYPNQETIHGLFARQVEKTPHHIALTGCPGLAGRPIQLTYAQLNHQANRLAELLISNGVCPHHTAAILVERSVDMIIALLAVLQAGAAYVPLDPKTPANRLHYVLQDCRATLLLTFRHLATPLPPTPPVLYLEELPISPSPTTFSTSTNPDHLAYIIYTSGSTGKPKGVPITHGNFSPLVHWGYHHLGINTADRVIQNLSYYFDWSVWEIFLTLTSGAHLHMITPETLLDPQAMVVFIQQHAITVLHITPTQYSYLLQVGLPMPTLRHLCIGAEKLTPDLVTRSIPFIAPQCRIYNMYGPTEATIISAVAEIPRDEPHLYPGLASVPIGSTIGNTALLVLDANLNPTPIQVTGELYIAGDALARGYLNDADKTAATFIPNPFPEVNGPRLYKTGDRVRRLPDHSILFIGRADFQVKIRGYRIELGEIESGLRQFPEIKDALVLVKEDYNQEKCLCAYIVCPSPLDIATLREFLAAKMPAYMLPTYFVQLDNMPLNPNGKVNLKVLPDPILTTGKEYKGPTNDIQVNMVAIWAEVLGLPTEQIGVTHNFFHLGGHSLKAISVINKIQKTFGVTIPLQDIFRYHTIAQIASLIQNSQVTGFKEIEKQPQKEYYELSYSQKRLWYISQTEPNNPLFNMPGKITLLEALDELALREALTQLVARHESLRTTFKQVNKEPFQVIVPMEQYPIHLDMIDISQLQPPQREQKRQQLQMAETRYIFKLEQPLFKMKVVKCGPTEYDLIFNMHHIISDGWSIEILKREFQLFFNARKNFTPLFLEPLALQYKDYAAWQNELLADQTLIKKALEFWRQQLSGEMPTLNLPYDYTPAATNKTSAGYRFVIPAPLTLQLQAMAEAHQASLFIVLLAGFNLMLAQVTAQKNIVIAIPAAARSHEALKNIIGMFVNTLILSNQVKTDEPFTHFFQRLQENTFHVLEYQDIPMELVCGQLKIKYPHISAFFNMVNIQNTPPGPLLNLDHYHTPETQNAKFDMVLYLNEFENGMDIHCHYHKDQFNPHTIEKLMGLYVKLLTDISSDPTQKIGDYFSSPKKRKLNHS